MSGVLLDPPTQQLTRRKFLVSAGAFAAAMTLYAGEFARHEIDIIARPISIRNLPTAFHGFRIAQISDIHFDEFTEPFFLERIVRKINALSPDLVLLTGDFITRGALTFAAHSVMHRCAEILSALTPQRFAALGNHDVSVDATLVTQTLKTFGIPVLVNQQTAIEKRGDRLWIAGLDDPGTSHPDLDLAIPGKPDAPVILMSHEPDYTNDILQHPRSQYIDLVLSGHSHGGQIRLPFAGPLILPPLGKIYPHGHYHLAKNLQLYVNRGIGTVGLPFRLNCPPEITHFTLNPA